MDPGHIAFSPETVSDGSGNWYGLGPLSVLPKYQKRGIGKALMKEGCHSSKACMPKDAVLGHPDYYRKFGFWNTPELVLEGVPREVFLVLSFDGRIPHGTVTFHDAFKMDGGKEAVGDI